MPEDRKKIVFSLISLLCCASFILVLLLPIKYWYDSTQMEKRAKGKARQQVEYAREMIGQKLEILQDIVTSIVNDLKSGKLTDEKLIGRMESVITEPRQGTKFHQVGAAYKPEAIPTGRWIEQIQEDLRPYTVNQKRLYAPGYTTKDGDPEAFHPHYDYTQPDIKDGSRPRTNWYYDPLSKNEDGVWHEPYFGTAAGTWLAEYGAPFYLTDESSQEKIKAGVIYANFSLDEVRKVVGSLDLGRTGYGFILTKEQNFVSYPIKEYLGKNIRELNQINSQDDRSLKEIVQVAIDWQDEETQTRLKEYKNKVTEESYWIFTTKIDSTGWTMGVILNEVEFLDGTEMLLRRQTVIAMAFIVFLLFISSLILRVDKESVPRLWGFVFSASFLFVAGICFICHQAKAQSTYESRGREPLFHIGSDNRALGDLGDERIPESLREGFGENGIEFSGDDYVKVLVQEIDKRWLITDEVNDRTYVVRNESKGRLDIYSSEDRSPMLTNKAVLDKFLQDAAELSRKLHEEQSTYYSEPIYVPTGVFVQSIEFASANNVILTGYIWQKYIDGKHDEISRGFVLPESETANIKEAYRRRKERHLLFSLEPQSVLGDGCIDRDDLLNAFEQRDIYLPKNFEILEKQNGWFITYESDLLFGNQLATQSDLDSCTLEDLRGELEDQGIILSERASLEKRDYVLLVNDEESNRIYSIRQRFGKLYAYKNNTYTIEKDDSELDVMANTEIIGWYFQDTLRQNFDYSKYPLDRQEIWIRIWHQDFDKNVILVPDLDAYNPIQPTSLPGLEQEDFVLTGWTTEMSFFDYRLNSYNTDFGIDNYVGQESFPELYYNISLKRAFTGPFVSNMIPLIAVAIILFTVLMMGTRDEEKGKFIGFSASGVLAACAGLFFTVIIAHVSVRADLAAVNVIYLEYFYFVMYFVILSVAVNSLLFSLSRSDRIRFIYVGDNLLAKLLYWPVLLGLLLIITFLVFY